HSCHTQIDRGKGAHRLAIVDGVFERFVRQAIPLLQEVDPPHALDPDRWTPTLTLGIVWLKDCDQPRPWDQLFHLREKTLPPRDFLLPGILGLGETHLLFHARHS